MAEHRLPNGKTGEAVAKKRSQNPVLHPGPLFHIVLFQEKVDQRPRAHHLNGLYLLHPDKWNQYPLDAMTENRRPLQFGINSAIPGSFSNSNSSENPKILTSWLHR